MHSGAQHQEGARTADESRHVIVADLEVIAATEKLVIHFVVEKPAPVPRPKPRYISGWNALLARGLGGVG